MMPKRINFLATLLCTILLCITICTPSLADEVSVNTEPLSVTSIQDNGILYSQNESTGELTVIGFESGVRDVTIPENIDGDPVVAIGEKAFYQCKTLRSINLPTSIRTIGKYAFYECSNLATVRLAEGLTAIHDYAFVSCTSMTQINFPNSLVYIGPWAFFDCVSLTFLQLPSALEEIGNYAFYYCIKLRTIAFPPSLTTIGSGAFSTCHVLNHITWPSHITTVNDHMFYNCISLSDIRFPEGVHTIAENVLHGCRSLRVLILPDSISLFCKDEYDDGITRTLMAHPGTYVESMANQRGIPFIPLLDLPFVDVTSNDWFYNAANFVYTQGLMQGSSSTDFSPNMVLSRAQFATILHRIDGTPAVPPCSNFPDVAENSWYTTAVHWASNYGIITGYPNGLFGTNDPITREQMAVILYRYIKNVLLLNGYEFTSLDIYQDHSQVSDYAEQAMAWAVACGIISGKASAQGVLLDPLGQTTRAECAAIIMRFMNYCYANSVMVP